MEVWARNPSRLADLCNDFSPAYFLSLSNTVALIVGIDRSESSGVADNNEVAVSSQTVAVYHLSAFDGSYRRSLRRRNIDPIVKGLTASPKIRGDFPRHGPHKAVSFLPSKRFAGTF